MNTILTIILTACIAALVTRLMMPAQQPPTVVYVPIETQKEEGGSGCLPIVAAVLVVFVLLTLFAK